MRSPERRTTRRTGRSPIARALIGTVAGFSLVAAACGGDDSSDDTGSTEAPAASAAEVVDGTDAEPDAPPATDDASATDAPPATDDVEVAERVVSLSPTHTEMMFAIGAGDLLVAVDDFSNYPPEALELPNDLSGYEPNVEAIAGHEPDLVLIGGDFTGLGDQLAAIGIESWDGPAAAIIDDTYAQIEQLGVLTGHTAEADALVAAMQADLDALIAAAPEPAEPLYLYHELDPLLYSVDSTTFLGELYAMFGLRNIADETEGSAAGYPQLNAEFIVSANPDLIFLADTKCCGETIATVSARDGWNVITAVQTGAVIEMDDDIASRWGPRVIEYAESVAVAIAAVS